MSMLDWNTYRQQLTIKVGEIAKLSPDTIKGYQALSAAGQKADLLGAKTRELISLAVAVAIRCDGCITVHTKKRAHAIAEPLWGCPRDPSAHPIRLHAGARRVTM